MIEIFYKVNGVEQRTTINRPVSDYGFDLDDGKYVRARTNEHIDHDFQHLPDCPDDNMIVYFDVDDTPYERIGTDGLRVREKRAIQAIRLAHCMWRRLPISIAAE